MQKCQKCNFQFSWKTLFWSILLAYKPIDCEKCGTSYAVTGFSRLWISIYTVVPLYIYGFMVAPRMPFSIYIDIGVMTSIAVFTLSIIPFVAKYSPELIPNKKSPLA
ncbi:TIGR04104 family putative zinc finger protein [Peribacillus acanthi]|uniref:TIGR04104 family putative zinc finger protein n=1 Tax=Peribacillus acanthi TaxID=2171554 RepID=UPI000D3E60B6|nr:TIGR04104 family putative zinc finger protein [Peribacillus acanthi]